MMISFSSIFIFRVCVIPKETLTKMLSRGPTTSTRRGNKPNPTQPSSSQSSSSSKILYHPHQAQAAPYGYGYGGATMSGRTTLTSNHTQNQTSFTSSNPSQNNPNSPAHIIHQYTTLLDHKNSSLQESRTTLSALRLLILKHGKFIISCISVYVSVFKYALFSMMMMIYKYFSWIPSLTTSNSNNQACRIYKPVTEVSAPLFGKSCWESINWMQASIPV